MLSATSATPAQTLIVGVVEKWIVGVVESVAEKWANIVRTVEVEVAVEVVVEVAVAVEVAVVANLEHLERTEQPLLQDSARRQTSLTFAVRIPHMNISPQRCLR